MKIIEITEEEALAIVLIMKATWVPIDKQKLVYSLVDRLEKELKS